jgi:hypothetical protein
MSKNFERVYTNTDYYDGPRKGIADFEGKPHAYSCIFERDLDGWSDIFLLMSINEDVLRLALEDWQIWCRWEAAFHQGTITLDSHPALPADRIRHEELKILIGNQLEPNPELSLKCRGEFRAETPIAGRGLCNQRLLEVRWIKIEIGK